MRTITVDVSCAHGHTYTQNVDLGTNTLEYIFTRAIPCCGVCGERENYTLRMCKWQVVETPQAAYESTRAIAERSF